MDGNVSLVRRNRKGNSTGFDNRHPERFFLHQEDVDSFVVNYEDPVVEETVRISNRINSAGLSAPDEWHCKQLSHLTNAGDAHVTAASGASPRRLPRHRGTRSVGAAAFTALSRSNGAHCG